MIDRFTGQYEFLSNFSRYPVELPWLQGLEFPTAEHAFQACKASTMSDVMMVHGAITPGEAKKAGRAVAIRPDWETVKRRMMIEVLLAKFGGDASLAKLLADTGSEVLVEGNTWGDRYWGAVSVVGKGPWPRENGRSLPGWGGLLAGHNWLGRILMMVREVTAP